MRRLSAASDQPKKSSREARDEAIRAIVHDLNGLLLTIVGNAYLLRLGRSTDAHGATDSPEATDATDETGIADIEEAGRRAAALVKELAAMVKKPKPSPATAVPRLPREPRTNLAQSPAHHRRPPPTS
jgi:signal transduction histidine kinase